MQTSLHFETFGTAYLNHVLHGNSEMIKHIIGLFRAQTPDLMNQLRQAVKLGNMEEIRATAHKMKSAAGILEARDIRNVLIEMEEEAKTGRDNERLSNLMNSLNQLVDKTMDEMNRRQN